MEVSRKTTTAAKSARVYLLDEIRGFEILCMVLYHAMYSLKFEFGVDVPVFFESWFDIIRDVFAGGFVFISGIMCRYSRDNVRRGAVCFFIGMMITFIVPFFSSEIKFGILHMLGISMMLYGLFARGLEKIPPIIGVAVFAALSAFTWNAPNGFVGFGGAFRWDFPAAAHNVGVLYPLGILPNEFNSSDYFPLMPWLFVFLTGSYVGYWFKNGSMPRMFYNSHAKWLGTVGRATIWVYILHVPLIYGIFSLIFR